MRHQPFSDERQGHSHPLSSARVIRWTLLLVSLGLVGCSGSILLPVRACVLEGTQLADLTQDDRDAAVQALFNDMNAAIWAQARVGFLVCCQEIPVIQDPDPELGPQGQIAYGTSKRVSDEMLSASDACAAAWAAKPGHFTKGPIVVFVRDITQATGMFANDLGITNPRPTQADLCIHPRALLPVDVEKRYSFVIEPAGFGSRADQKQGSTRNTLAHELGHIVLLFHGDGLDNDANGSVPPTSGPRLFDSECDASETETSLSLMSEGANHITVLTPLQIELARSAAVAWPGYAGGDN